MGPKLIERHRIFCSPEERAAVEGLATKKTKERTWERIEWSDMPTDTGSAEVCEVYIPGYPEQPMYLITKVEADRFLVQTTTGEERPLSDGPVAEVVALFQ